ncbi:MAG: sodium:alanine symporter family protein [Waddliaceae bacterium]|jgi:alanine or glycine:cation symporter, AGCS family|nr:sodium:alanine symporter family protein [Waddliaceae bacterium]MBT3579063.1 sodium:alanine symporter family protein [Waddliaceae bacterium]MBT4444773.1 sodium:alanine symporter family protein [Waddliaceae bacterium]MBT6928042.1 sodium:alanine symporter family protein [Waddliaceae bacterium]MBT7264426.1 sodium:alanine symporter family protein [Waddliaceae bacterium]
MDRVSSYLDSIYNIVWGPWFLLFIIIVALRLSYLLHGIQFRYLRKVFSILFGKKNHNSGEGDISPFQSLMTSLAATIGVSNIVGVTFAVTIGGYGSLLWIWVIAFIGMAVKYSEALLAVKYRHYDKERDEMAGGPMYYIERALGWKWLASFFAFAGILSTLGGGNMIQANSIAGALHSVTGISPIITGVVLAAVTAFVIMGGIKSIGKTSSFLVPFMGALYIFSGFAIVVMNYHLVPDVMGRVFLSAFTGKATFGGIAGYGIMVAMQAGITRGVVSSEVGMGSSSIAAAAARTECPSDQALISMTGSFFATIIVSTITVMVLGISGVLESGSSLGGAALVTTAFAKYIPGGGIIVTAALIFFAYSTIVGWAYYGEKFCYYLFGNASTTIYRIIFIAVLIPGATLNLHVVWRISDIVNGLITLPNLIALAFLSKVVVAETKRIFNDQ